MSASVSSAIATAQALALVRGPGAGVHGQSASAPLRILDDSVSVPVGSPSVATATDYIRFGKLPKGAKIIPHLSRLTTNHTAAIAGKLTLVPLDGTTSTDIASVTVQVETVALTGNAQDLEHGSILDNRASVEVTTDSWIQFVPASDLTIASTAKTVYARIVYSSLL